MCWLFHKWSKWSGVKRELVVYTFFSRVGEQATQSRTCLRCGRYEERAV